ncbi:hypothetical protein AB1Y20_004591 [Prymnesium parvum]|uniref:Uncharacterized protein n=1 Tax=Prymnesium parvum TaxID=97485 RepID=A0AB34J0R7_PRYPA
MLLRADRKRTTCEKDQGTGAEWSAPEARKSARSEAKQAALDISQQSLTPPPDGWEWPHEGDLIEVEIRDKYGETAWEKAKVNVVLTDGWFQARITTLLESWDDWFSWREEGVDWRRKRRAAASVIRSSNGKREVVESKRQAEKPVVLQKSGGPGVAPSVRASSGASLSDKLRNDYSKLRLRLDHVGREAILLPSLTVIFPAEPRPLSPTRRASDHVQRSFPSFAQLMGKFGGRPARGQKLLRLDVPDGALPHLSIDESLVGMRVRWLMPDLTWSKGAISAFCATSRKHTVRLDRPKRGQEKELQRTLPDHRADILLDVAPFLEKDDEVERFLTEEEDEEQEHAESLEPRERTEVPSGLRLLTSKISKSGFRHVRELPHGAGLCDDVEPSTDADIPNVFAARFWHLGKQKAIGPFYSAVAAAAAYSRFVIAEYEGEAASAALQAEAAKAASRRAAAALEMSAREGSQRDVRRDEMVSEAQTSKEPPISREERYAARKAEGARFSLGERRRDTVTDESEPKGEAATDRREKSRGEKSFFLPEKTPKQKKLDDGYDDSVVGRRVRAYRESDGVTCNGTITERIVAFARGPKYRIRYDDGEEDEVTLPDETVILLPKDDGGFDENSSLSLDEQRKAWAAEAHAAELQAKEEQVLDGLTLYTSNKTDSGYRCVHSQYLSRLGVFAYEVRANRDGRTVHLGRFKSKLQAAVAFARYTASSGSSAQKETGNMVIEPVLPESTKEDGINTIEKLLDVRTIVVDCLEPPPQPVMPPSSLPYRSRTGVASLAEGCDVVEALARCRRTRASLASAVVGAVTEHADQTIKADQDVQVVAFCKQGHEMTFQLSGESGSHALLCDGCTSTIQPSSPRLSCSSCDFDLCTRCGGERMEKRVVRKEDVDQSALPAPMEESTMTTLDAPVASSLEAMDCEADERVLAESLADETVKVDNKVDADHPDTLTNGSDERRKRISTTERGDATSVIPTTLAQEKGDNKAPVTAPKVVGKREVPTLGEILQVEVDENGKVTWKNAEVRQVMPSRRFYVCVNNDEDFIESYGMEDEFKEWRRTGKKSDLTGRDVTKVEVREYLCKLRGYSYRQSKWICVAEIEEDGPLSANALKKFERKLVAGEPIDTSYQQYMTIERVISHRHRRGQLEYLIKPRGLTYADCSWERATLLTDSNDIEAINKYHVACKLDPAKLSVVSRPPAHAWLKPGVSVEMASISSKLGGLWSVAKVLESTAEDVLVEYEKRESTEGPGSVCLPQVARAADGSEVRGTVSENHVEIEAKATRTRERVKLTRVRPLPPRTPKDFAPVVGQAVQVQEGNVWRAAVVKAVRRKGEQLLDDEKFFQLRREQARKRAALQASLQPAQDADELSLGSRLIGRDGKQWEVVLADDGSHRFVPVRQAAKSAVGGTKRRRCGVCAGCTSQDCGRCRFCLDMPKFGGPNVRRQSCEQRACLNMLHEDREDRERKKKEAANRASLLMAERKAKQESRQVERRSSRVGGRQGLQLPESPDALVKDRYPRSAVVGKRLVVGYEEENESGEMEIVRYSGVVVDYSIQDGLLVHFDGYSEDDAVWVEEDGVDDWDWEQERALPSKEQPSASRMSPGSLTGKSGDADEAEDHSPYQTTRVPPCSESCASSPAPDSSGIVEDTSSVSRTGGGTVLPDAEVIDANATESKTSDSLVKGKKRSKVSGSRVVVDYEEDVENSKTEIKRYSGVVVAYSTTHGLCVRFDGYADDDEEGEAWVEEDGVDDWDWEERALQYATEVMHLVVDSCGLESWKTLKELRPNWVWWSIDDGWSIDDEETWQEVYSAISISESGSAAEVKDDDDILLTSSERAARTKTQHELDAKSRSEVLGDDDKEVNKTPELSDCCFEEDGLKENTRKADQSASTGRWEADADYQEKDMRGRGAGSDDGSDEDMEPTEVRGWRKLEESPDFLCNGCKLRSYQLDGLNWMRLSYYLGRNVILGDEMGLGKTAQSVSMLQSLRSIEGVDGPFLIVAPLSTLPHWERELSLWTDMYWVNFHGSADSRRVVQQYEWFQNEKQPKGEEKYRFQVLLCNYETVVQDPDALLSIKWQYMIVDEGHRLKNRASRSLEVMSCLRSKRKLVLSGTPLQNHISELWTIMNFLEPRKFDNFDSFLAKFGSLSSGDGTAKQVQRLNKLLKPHLLRRVKEDVEHSLPGMKETLLYVEITNLQKMCYRAVLERNREILLRGAGAAGLGPSFNNVSMMLRHCCNHPWLIPDVEEGALAQLDAEWDERTRSGTDADGDLERQRRYTERLVQSSGKFVLLQKLLPKLQAEGHRVLIFSQFTKVLDLFEDFMEAYDFSYERLDGSIAGSARQQAIDRFSDPESNCFIFLLSTRAGGQGINLTAADTVIVFDPDWNPQNDVQAMARCHRIGQTKAVQVYKLCTKGTYENHMLMRSNHKLGLEHAIMRTGEHGEKLLTSTGFAKSEKVNEVAFKERAVQIELLLKSGAQCLEAGQDEDAAAFNQSSIEDILTHYVEEIDDSSESAGHRAKRKIGSSSTFSQATIMSDRGSSIGMDDPNFWEKMLPGDHAAINADAAMASKLSGADRIKGLKLMDFDDPAKTRRFYDIGEEERSSRKRARVATVQKAKSVAWKQKDMEDFCDSMLAVGHSAAPQTAITAASSSDEPPTTRQYERMADYILALSLLHASPSLKSQWPPQMGFHTLSDESFYELGVEVKRPANCAGHLKLRKGALAASAGGTPRPRGRPPMNDQGRYMSWSYTRGMWFDRHGGTVKGVQQFSATERQQIVAENEEFEERIRQMKQEPKIEQQTSNLSSQGGVDDAGMKADLRPESDIGLEDEDGGQDLAEVVTVKSTPSEGTNADGEVNQQNQDAQLDSLDRALRRLAQRVRPAGSNVEWLVHETAEKANTWLARLLELRREDSEA